MRNLINNIISKIKHEPYVMDQDLRLTVVVNEAVKRFFRAVLGSFRLRSHGTFPVFMSKGVQIRDKTKLSVGKGSTIEKEVVLDAMSRKGLIIHENVKIGRYSQIRCSGSMKQLGVGVEIGKNSGLGEFSFLGAAGGIKIGDNVIMGQNIRMHAENHNYADSDVLIRLQGVVHKGIVIEDNCWIGAGVVILDGVTIGQGCVIGANSLVTRNIPANSVAVGSPARVIKSRME